ncbi:MAG: ACT domain-containing protein [Candidatus Aminicenantes bacterium]|nr:ACT domain-containing protein [Candidatus Aminicenantes bacterium]
MAKAKKIKNLVFTLPNKVGLLSEVSAALAAAKVNINAIWAYEMEDKAYFVLTVDSPVRATKALVPMGAEIKEEEAVAVEMPNRPGELEKVAKRLADAGININLVYGTTGSGKTSTCFFKTADNKKAIRLINK